MKTTTHGIQVAGSLRYIIAVLLALCATTATALPVSLGSPLRADFNLQPIENPQFDFPADLISYTVSFSGDTLNIGEALRIDTYTSNGAFLGSDSYTNSAFGSIIGCACFDINLLAPLNDSHFYAMLYSLSGTFKVTEIVALAFDNNNDTTRSFGVLHQVPEPGTLALLGLGLAGLTATRRRKP